MRLRNTVIALTLLLGACAGSGNSSEVQAVQRVTQACATYDATLRSLALMRAGGNLSDNQIAMVDTWRPIMNGICTGEVPATAAAGLLDTAEKALFELSKIEGGS